MDSALKDEQHLLRTYIHIKSLKFSFGLSVQPRAIEFLWQKVWVNLAEEFFGEISKPSQAKIWLL